MTMADVCPVDVKSAKAPKRADTGAQTHNTLAHQGVMSSYCDESSVASSCEESESNPTGSITTAGTTNRGDKSSPTSEHVATKQQTKEVTRLRLVVLFVLISSAIGFSTSTYLYLNSIQKEAFHRQFRDDSSKVLEAIGSNFDRTLASLDSVAVTLVSHARATNQTWPFVTVPDFAVRMAKVLPQSNAIIINVVPVVAIEQRREWETYSVQNDEWVNNSQVVQNSWDKWHGPVVMDWKPNADLVGDFGVIEPNASAFHLPTWQNFPVIANTSYTYNFDWMSVSNPTRFARCLKDHKASVSAAYMIPTPDDPIRQQETELWGSYFGQFIDKTEEPIEPFSDIQYPIVDTIDQVVVAGAPGYNPENHKSVGMVVAQMYWRGMIRNILPEGSTGIHVVVTNPCSDAWAYQIDGPNIKYLGIRDESQQQQASLSVGYKLHELGALSRSEYSGAKLDTEYCISTVYVNASDDMKVRFMTNDPIFFSCAVLLIFVFTSFVFYCYDAKVERRQQFVMETADRSSAIVSSLFPTNVREKLYVAPSEDKGEGKHTKRSSDGASIAETVSASPNAELYPDTTVLFADVCGFTAWSSVRTPCQVFQLLETLYGAFDVIAKKRGVFKVETIGDCYVAAVGLPVPRKHHAVVMARFAKDIRSKMLELVAGLDKTLGPGTGELALRVGLNSGPTTAGVLRGEKARFQLFGDTVNTAARMESNGERNRIQVSQKTAELLQVAGKSNWLTMRSEKIECKGKGLMTTYWCEPRANAAAGSVVSGSDVSGSEDVCHEPSLVMETMDLKTQRLVDWNVDLLQEMIQEVLSERAATGSAHINYQETSADNLLNLTGNPVDEVTDVLHLPDEAPQSGATSKLPLGDVVVSQLRDLMTSIAGMYQANPFHNFEHCSHVTMSTKKLLSRIVGGEGGMTIDALTQFAIVFGAIVHDVDHPGVSNSQLVKENSTMAVKYSGQSVAEQNSVDLAWHMLMQSRFNELRTCLCPSKAELQRFRQVVVNVVMATDLFDKNLKALRDTRWETSFSAGSNETSVQMLQGDDLMRRKTIVIELIIQASDVSHTMQHFTVYKKWNSNLMKEMYEAYQNGRLAKDPTEGWYEGELWFFDNYVIPLAQKLRECQVFGVSCDEFLDYAKDNRMEWEMKGRDIVQQAVQEFHVHRMTGVNAEPFEA